MQSLTAVGYGLRELQRTIDALLDWIGEPGVVAHQIREMIAELATAEVALRALITTLEGHGDEEIDTVDVIAAAEIARFSRCCNAAVEVIVQPDFRPDTHSQAIAIQYVLREALTNVAKQRTHARCWFELRRARPRSCSRSVMTERASTRSR